MQTVSESQFQTITTVSAEWQTHLSWIMTNILLDGFMYVAAACTPFIVGWMIYRRINVVGG